MLNCECECFQQGLIAMAYHPTPHVVIKVPYHDTRLLRFDIFQRYLCYPYSVYSRVRTDVNKYGHAAKETWIAAI